MTDQVQIRGGTTANHTAFTGAVRELTVDTTKKTVVVHDGVTAGGNPLLRQDMSNLALTAPQSDQLKANLGLSAPNLADNSNFSVNQRGVSGTVVLAASQYGHDRFKAGTGGCTYTFSTTNNITTVTISAGTLVQVTPAENIEAGTHVVTWTGTSTCKINGGTASASGVTAVLPAGVNASFEFTIGTVSQIKIERGTVGTPYRRQKTDAELLECLRYFWKSGERGYYFSTAATFFIQYVHPVLMRVAPTGVVRSQQSPFTAGKVYDSIGATDRSATISQTGLDGGRILTTESTVLTPGQLLFTVELTADL